MPSQYTITEPHPTVPQNSYTHSGRGGAGNFFRAPATTSPAGVPTPATLSTIKTSSTGNSSGSSSSSPRRFYSGRGGAGNIFSSSSSSSFPFGSKKKSSIDAGLDGDSLTRRDSASTEGSTRSNLSGFWGRVRSVGH